jgi:hypothetical protein
MLKNEFDEMQSGKRNKIGIQSFFMLVFLLMIDMLLYNMGIRWVEYPTNVFIIVLLCNGIFLIRSILNGAFLAPKQKAGSYLVISIVTTVLSLAALVLVAIFVKPHVAEKPTSGIGVILLLAISWGVIIAAAIIYSIKHHIEKRKDD